MRSYVLAATLIIFSIATHAEASIVKIDVSAGAHPYYGALNMMTITNDLVKLQANTGDKNPVELGHNDVRIDLSYRNIYEIDPATGILIYGYSNGQVDMNYSFSVNYTNPAQEQNWIDMANSGFRENTPDYISSATELVMTTGIPDGITNALLGIDHRSVSVSSLSGTSLDALSSPADDPGHFLSFSLQGVVRQDIQAWDPSYLLAPLSKEKLQEFFFDPYPIDGYDTGLAGADQAAIDQYLNDYLPSGFDLTIMLTDNGATYDFSSEMHIRYSDTLNSTLEDGFFYSLDHLGGAIQAVPSVYGLEEGVSYAVQSENIDAPTPTPEPATMLLFGTGIAGLTGIRLRRKKKA